MEAAAAAAASGSESELESELERLRERFFFLLLGGRKGREVGSDDPVAALASFSFLIDAAVELMFVFLSYPTALYYISMIRFCS